jgi:GAF domain-containing protein
MDPLRAFAELGLIKFSETNLDGVLERILELARRALPGADEVSITLVRAGRPHTTAATSELARRLEDAQRERLGGPSLEATGENTTVSIEDIAAETRWNGWPDQAAAAGIRAGVSVGLPIRDTVSGALTIYSRTPGAVRPETVARVRAFSGYATVALANALLYETTVTHAEQLRTAMETRSIIEQAKGVIMSRRRCTADEAFAILTKISQDSNRKLRDIASTLVAQMAGPPPPSADGEPAAGREKNSGTTV